MNKDEVFESLARNAFDFLTCAIEEFEQSPKFSVIHFCAAVEMLLKARLMQEHWSLIVSKPEHASITKFISGDFVSVRLDEVRARIRGVVGEEISDIAFKSFQDLANHRNKMIHFFHDGVDKDGKEKEKIIAEYCRSWYHLHRLLVRWDAYFSKFSRVIRHADAKMMEQRKYLTAKFSALRDELERHDKRGYKPVTCDACGFVSAIPDKADKNVITAQCLVCNHASTQVIIECPHCSEKTTIVGEGYAKCAHCLKAIEPDDLVAFITGHDDAHRSIKGGGEHCQQANCGHCDGHYTVVAIGEGYLCTCCFEMSDSAEQCGTVRMVH